MDPYGYELILDLKNCDTRTFTRDSIGRYFEKLCDLIDMEKCEVHFWDDVGVAPEEQQSNPKTKGTSAVCFILTSTIVIHTLDLLEAAYINIFSCEQFDADQAAEFTRRWFGASTVEKTTIQRK